MPAIWSNPDVFSLIWSEPLFWQSDLQANSGFVTCLYTSWEFHITQLKGQSNLISDHDNHCMSTACMQNLKSVYRNDSRCECGITDFWWFKSPFLRQIQGNLEGDYLALYQKLSSGFFSIYPCLLIFTVSRSGPFDDTLECKQDINARLKKPLGSKFPVNRV